MGNCLLESTMTVFVLGAVLCILHKERRWLWHLLGGLLLCAAFLTKGFTGLFPLALPFLLWIFGLRKGSFVNMVGLTLLAVLATAAPVAVMVLTDTRAEHFFDIYLHHQVLRGVGVHVVENRWYVVGRYFIHTAALWGTVLVTLTVALLRKKPVSQLPCRSAMCMLTLGLCGVVPMMVSYKQRDFYLLTAYPYMVVAMSLLMTPYVGRLTQQIALAARKPAIFYTIVVLAVLLPASAAAVAGANANHFCRDKVLQADMEVVLTAVDEGEHVGIPHSMRSQWALLFYYYLGKHIALGESDTCRHLLTDGKASVPEGYVEVPLPTQQYKLYCLSEQ